jgi:hypothetical protein
MIMQLPKGGRAVGATALAVEAGIRSGRTRPRRDGQRWKCNTCSELFTAYAAAERHVDEQHRPGARIECLIEGAP